MALWFAAAAVCALCAFVAGAASNSHTAPDSMSPTMPIVPTVESRSTPTRTHTAPNPPPVLYSTSQTRELQVTASAGTPLTLEDSEAGRIWDIIQRYQDSTKERTEHVISALQASGTPDAELARTGREMAKRLETAGLVSNWNCHRQGCYFQLAKDSDDIMGTLSQVRDEIAPTNLMAVTAGEAPYRIAVLLNFKQE